LDGARCVFAEAFLSYSAGGDSIGVAFGLIGAEFATDGVFIGDEREDLQIYRIGAGDWGFGIYGGTASACTGVKAFKLVFQLGLGKFSGEIASDQQGEEVFPGGGSEFAVFKKTC